MVRPWWQVWPGRLRAELKALRRSGIPWAIDRSSLPDGPLRFRLSLTIEGESTELVATFPALYPFFRFEVSVPGLSLTHHQHPVSKNLCLLSRGTENWVPSMLLADVLRERLPIVLRTGAHEASAEDAAPFEEHQAEPFSDYYPYAPNTCVIIDGNWQIPPNAAGGTITLGVQRVRSPVMRAAILEVRDDQGSLCAKAAPRMSKLFPLEFQGRWIRCPGPIEAIDPGEFLAALVSRRGSLEKPRTNHLNDLVFDVIGVVFPEETAWRQMGDGWTFLVRWGDAAATRKGRKWRYQFARPVRAGASDTAARVPELHVLARKSVALLGVGGLGAPSALELARAGVGELRLLDHDFIDPATSSRYPLGVSAAGRIKVEAVAEQLLAHCPHTNIIPLSRRLGAEESLSELRDLESFLERTDLIYDASAEPGVQQFLASYAREKGVPYVCTWTLPGAWGGLIARIVPGLTSGCWICLQHALTEDIIPYPPHDTRGNVQPIGCADPTFTGSGFDLTWIASSAVRMAVATLCRGVEGAYPDSPWDILIMQTRNASGEPVPPTSAGVVLAKNPACPACSK